MLFRFGFVSELLEDEVQRGFGFVGSSDRLQRQEDHRHEGYYEAQWATPLVGLRRLLLEHYLLTTIDSYHRRFNPFRELYQPPEGQELHGISVFPHEADDLSAEGLVGLPSLLVLRQQVNGIVLGRFDQSLQELLQMVS